MEKGGLRIWHLSRERPKEVREKLCGKFGKEDCKWWEQQGQRLWGWEHAWQVYRSAKVKESGWRPPVSIPKSTSAISKCESKQMPASQADAPRQANEPLPNTVREPLAGPLPSWPLRQVSLCSQARELFTQMVLWTWALLVFKATLFGGLVPQVQVLKVRGAPCGVQDLFSSGRSSRFWPWVTARAGVYGSIVSQPLLPGSTWAFSPPPTCRSHVASFCFCFCFPDKVVPYVTVDSVCSWKGMGSGPFCVAILNVIYQYLFECDICFMLSTEWRVSPLIKSNGEILFFLGW